MSFLEAMKQIIDGKKVTKKQWEDKNIYCFMNGEWLSIHQDDGKNYRWTINAADMWEDDWEIVE
jgi:hypothetical protein